jgi:hypothetical protein
MARASRGSPHLLRLQIQHRDYETVRTLQTSILIIFGISSMLTSNDSCLL